MTNTQKWILFLAALPVLLVSGLTHAQYPADWLQAWEEQRYQQRADDRARQQQWQQEEIQQRLDLLLLRQQQQADELERLQHEQEIDRLLRDME